MNKIEQIIIVLTLANDNTKLQPNCGFGGLACSHGRAYLYYISSISNPNCFIPYTKDTKLGAIKMGYLWKKILKLIRKII